MPGAPFAASGRRWQPPAGPPPAPAALIPIPPGHVWLQGDNAANSTDLLSNASSFATGMDLIFQICDMIASVNFWLIGGCLGDDEDDGGRITLTYRRDMRPMA